MEMITLVLLVCSILSRKVYAYSEQCFADIEDPYAYFGTKTAYYSSRASKIITEENCTPTYVWALIRHGTRYPSSNFITSVNKLNILRDEIISNHKDGRGKLCQKDLENLQKWKSSLTVELDDQLTPQGKSEQIFLAQQLKEAFPEVLRSSNKDTVLFQSSMAKRAKDSAIAFSNELLGTNFASVDGNHITENENILHVNKHCPNFEKNVENNPSTYKEVELFKKSDVIKNSILDISARLGYKQSLPYDSVELMYNICAYETAWDLNSRPAFCAAFLPEDFKVFEYLNDLEDYHARGYGSSYSEKIGCVTVRDMMMSLHNAAENPQSTRKATFHFSHSEMIVPTTVKLGLNLDVEPLIHTNYNRMKSNRKWRLASFDSFASNIIAVLYKCPSTNGTRNIVSFYQNEHKVILPKCTTNPCTLDNLEQNFNDVLDEEKCNLKFCYESQPLKTSSSSGCSVVLNLSVLVSCIVLAYFT
ncbi:multiple inositol polyphosphate phosphatase 1-like [Planococcus citri]|uniref:multiple inositol polyphosphate phosphatase 1-like n=1 Tax=Planococcus citri TaxID=170843 RepID=UPI0031F9C461